MGKTQGRGRGEHSVVDMDLEAHQHTQRSDTRRKKTSSESKGRIQDGRRAVQENSDSGCPGEAKEGGGEGCVGLARAAHGFCAASRGLRRTAAMLADKTDAHYCCDILRHRRVK